jgi:hypothetical protein
MPYYSKDLHDASALLSSPHPCRSVSRRGHPSGPLNAVIVEVVCRDLLQQFVACLLPASTDSQWWQRYVNPLPKEDIDFLPKRLKFSGSRHNAPFPCAVVTFRPPMR